MTAPLTLTRPQAAVPPRRQVASPSTAQSSRNPIRGQDFADERARIAATATSLAVACLEVLSGVRRSETIARWVEPELLAKIDHRCQLRAEVAPQRATVPGARTVQPGTAHVCQVSPEVAEVTVIVAAANRVRAVAVRLELLTTRWTLTALQTM
ncbi:MULTISPECIES: Rv3235 family protein [unclassified Brevibacterium]|uniref:Rv3235 family protein n=1 Tax=unclassified Brevibacterium TaxID=2614124 RepID=UPI001092BF0F|nr:Rv3235 family protein [Brevibacterium sp. S22]TGD33177.1 energy transducer TonB [Brevibacterium sp. S22]